MLYETFPLSIGYLMLEDSLGDPYYRLINVLWLPFLKIKKFRVPSLEKNRVHSLKIRKFRVNFISCFLQEMKFIFKLGCCLIMEDVSFSIPHLRKTILKIHIQKTPEIKKIEQFEQIWYLGHTDFDFFGNFGVPKCWDITK